MWYIHRSKPKPKEAPKPVGRPPMSMLQKRCLEMGEMLRGVYLKQREFFGDEFEKYFGEQAKELEEAINSSDLNKLTWFVETQPWVQCRKRQAKGALEPDGEIV